ncbi:hypothetical protein [Alishewanella longhuensis]
MNKRQFIKHSALALGMLPLAGCSISAAAATSANATPSRILPKALNKGDTVGLIASSAAVADLEDFGHCQRSTAGNGV